MSDQCTELKRLYKEIPVFGYGTYLDLNRVYMEARPIILSIAAKDENMKYSLGVSSVEIDTLISLVRSSNTKAGQKDAFQRAAEQLGEDIRSAMKIIGCE